MHILILPSRYMKPTSPLRGYSFREQGEALIRRGHRVGMLVPPSRLFTLNGLKESIQGFRENAARFIIQPDAQIPTYRLPWWRLRPAFQHAKRADLGLETFDAYVREHGMPDVLHARGLLYGGYLAAAIKARYGIPFVVTEQESNYLNGLIFPWQRPLIRETMAQADHRLVMIPQMAENLKRMTGEMPIEIIGNSVNSDFFQPGPALPADAPFTFILLATLRPIKAIDLTLRAFARAFAGRPEFQLKIAGEGPEGPKLKKLAAQLKIESQVSFLGVLDRESARTLMQSSHVLLSSSHYETFGNTLVEAMACGKPVVATCSGGPQFIITPENGLLTPLRDVNALAQAMQTIHQHYNDYDPQRIRQSVVDRFSEHAIINRLEAIYKLVTQ